MTDLRNKLVLIDFEIEKTILKKKQLDFYLAELYELREDTYTDYENQEKHLDSELEYFIEVLLND